MVVLKLNLKLQSGHQRRRWAGVCMYGWAGATMNRLRWWLLSSTPSQRPRHQKGRWMGCKLVLLTLACSGNFVRDKMALADRCLHVCMST